MAFVRNCKFTSASSLPGIKFMISSLVELLAIDPPTTYHHAFVYIRQLAVHLRTALTSGKKDAQQVAMTAALVMSSALVLVFSVSVQLAVSPLPQPLDSSAVSSQSCKPTPTHLSFGASLPWHSECTAISQVLPHQAASGQTPIAALCCHQYLHPHSNLLSGGRVYGKGSTAC